jgi:hypothetical protein
MRNVSGRDILAFYMRQEQNEVIAYFYIKCSYH